MDKCIFIPTLILFLFFLSIHFVYYKCVSFFFGFVIEILERFTNRWWIFIYSVEFGYVIHRIRLLWLCTILSDLWICVHWRVYRRWQNNNNKNVDKRAHRKKLNAMWRNYGPYSWCFIPIVNVRVYTRCFTIFVGTMLGGKKGFNFPLKITENEPFVYCSRAMFNT